MCSATAFTVLGCANKFITLLANAVILGSATTTVGNVALVTCLGASIAYGEFSKEDHITVIAPENTTTPAPASCDTLVSGEVK